MKETELYLIRHGETVWNVERRYQGQLDIPLNDKGREQAKQLGQFMSGIALDALYASDLNRAIQTAEQIARHCKGLKIKTHSGLRERSFGEWEGMTAEEIAQQHDNHLEVRRKGGLFGVERIEDFQNRIAQMITELARNHLGHRVAIVSHGGSINTLLHRVTDGRLGTGVTSIGNTSVTRLKFSSSEEWEVLEVNQAPHLQGG